MAHQACIVLDNDQEAVIASPLVVSHDSPHALPLPLPLPGRRLTFEDERTAFHHGFRAKTELGESMHDV